MIHGAHQKRRTKINGVFDARWVYRVPTAFMNEVVFISHLKLSKGSGM